MAANDRIENARDAAGAHFGHGFHCAEAVAWYVLEALGEDPEQAAAHATAFGGGVGRSFEEACGALTGGLIAIGHLYGRRSSGGDWDLAANFGAELRQRFIQKFGTTHCASLRENFGQEQQAKCRMVVEWVVGALLELLRDNAAPCRASACSCAAVAG